MADTKKRRKWVSDRLEAFPRICRAKGLKVGMLRPKVVWPFPEARIRELAGRVNAFVVAELNYGQMFFETERAVAGRAEVHLIGHGGGTVHEPELLLDTLAKAIKG